jgi:hypothetical protein
MQDEVLLVIGPSRMLMTPDEAFAICETINGSARIGARWSGSGNVDVIQPPSMESFVAYVVPMTGLMRMTLEVNEKEIKGR